MGDASLCLRFFASFSNKGTREEHIQKPNSTTPGIKYSFIKWLLQIRVVFLLIMKSLYITSLLPQAITGETDLN